MRRSGALSLVLIVLVALGALGATLAAGNSPELGLDLQGGASVVLQPEDDVEGDQLDEAIEIIRNRVDALGVAEPDIARQGDSIIVQLPGVEDQQRALDVVGRTAELRFRPVLTSFAPGLNAQAPPSTVPAAPVDPGAPGTTAPPATSAPPSTEPAPTEPAPTEPAPTEPATGQSPRPFAGLSEGESAAPFQADEPSTTTVAPTTTATAPTPTTSSPPAAGAEGDGAAPVDDYAAACGQDVDTVETDVATETVILPGSDEDEDGQPDACYQLGPVPTEGELVLTGAVIDSARAQIPSTEWIVSLDFKGEGLSLFNRVGQECFDAGATCPSRRIAITLDGRVESAPSIQPENTAYEPFDSNNPVTISGGGSANAFSEGEAKNLALVLRYGALPVQLEPQTVQTVSATLGRDSLNAGLAAGVGGVVLVALYIILYYRALGLVVILGLGVWSALNYSIISYLGASSGLALSLSGVTGIVVSVGVTVDSYIVYFERLKDEIRSGKTIRSSVDRGFKRAFRTILAADTSAFIGAALLYWLTVGPVRGFAFFLGLSTLLDIVVAYCFTRPLVAILARSRFFTEARWVGVARGLGARGASRAGLAPAVAGGAPR